MYPSVRYKTLKFGQPPESQILRPSSPSFPALLCHCARLPWLHGWSTSRPPHGRPPSASARQATAYEGGRGLSRRSRLARLLDEPWPGVVASEMVVAVRAAINAVAELERGNGERMARRAKV